MKSELQVARERRQEARDALARAITAWRAEARCPSGEYGVLGQLASDVRYWEAALYRADQYVNRLS